jgi:hypothetical protein
MNRDLFVVLNPDVLLDAAVVHDPEPGGSRKI